jgi:hypothetical protein
MLDFHLLIAQQLKQMVERLVVLELAVRGVRY